MIPRSRRLLNVRHDAKYFRELKLGSPSENGVRQHIFRENSRQVAPLRGSGYKSEKGTGTFETLYSKDAPEGDAYLKWSPGQLDDKLVQHLVVGDDFDPEPGFQIDARLKALSQSGEEIRK